MMFPIGFGVLGAVRQLLGPSLNLDFTSGNRTLDPRITFSRASNATVTGPDGTLQYAPHNLLTFSEQFDNAAWIKTNTTVTANTAIAPDGTATADTVSRTADGSNTRNTRANFTTNQTGTYTYSQYVKPEGNTDRVVLRLQDNAAVGGHCVFDLVGVGSIFSSTSATGTIEKIGDWYRVSVTVSLSGAFTSVQCLMFLGAYGTSVDPDPVSVWGAQLNVGPLQPYYPTTVKNLLGYTQEFDNAAWTKSNATVTANAVTAPDGSRTADKLVENAANDSHLALSTLSFLSGTSYTYSIYGKEDATSAKRYLTLFLPGTAFSGANYWCSFDLATGAVINGSASIVGSATAMGNGWYRCSVQATANLTGSGGVQIRLQNADNNITNYTGDGTSGIYIWGAQLSDSASLDPYVYNPGAAPDAAAYYGPRFDYDPVTLAPKGLLIEEQRTNSIRNNTMQGAVAGTPGTLPTNWNELTVAGVARTVEDVGVEDGIQYIDVRFAGTPTTTADYSIRAEQTTQIVASSGQVWTGSFFARVIAGSVGALNPRVAVIERTAVGGFIASTETPLVASSNLRNARTVVARTVSVSGERVDTAVIISCTNGVAIDITLRIGMPQLEQGAFATSAIPTSDAAATRAADVAVMTGANFSNWYRQDEGTLFAEWSSLSTAVARAFTVNDATQNNAISLTHSGTAYGGDVYVAGAFQGVVGPSSSLVANAVVKHAIGVALNNANTTANGTNGTTDTAVLVPTVTQALIGAGRSGLFHNGHIRRIGFFPRRLSNSELQGITS